MVEEAGLFFDVGPHGSDRAEKEIRQISQSFASLSGYVRKVSSDAGDLESAMDNGMRSSSASMLAFSKILSDGGKKAQEFRTALESATSVLSDPTSNESMVQTELAKVRELTIAHRDAGTSEVQAAQEADLAIRGIRFAQFNELVTQQEKVLAGAKRSHDELAQLSKGSIQTSLDAQVTKLRAAAHSADEFTASVEKLRPAVTALGGDLDKSIKRAHIDDMWRNLGEFKKSASEFVAPIKAIGGGIKDLITGAYSLGTALQKEVLTRLEGIKKMPEGAGWEGRRAIDTSERRAGARLGVSEQAAARATLSMEALTEKTHTSIPEMLKLSDALGRAGFSYEASTGQAGDYLRMTAKLVSEQGMSVEETIKLAQVSDATGESMEKLAGSALMAERTFGKMGSLEEMPGILDQARKNALGLGRVFTGEMATRTADSISRLGQLISVKLKTGIKEATEIAKGFANEAANIADEYEMMLGGLSDGFSGKGLAAMELFGQIGVNFERFVQSGGQMLPEVADKLAGLVKGLQGTGGALYRVRGLIGQAFGKETATAILAASNSGKGFAATEREIAEAAKRKGLTVENTTKAWEAAESSMRKSIELSEKQFIVNVQNLQILSVTRDTVRDHLATINNMSDKVIQPMLDTFKRIDAAQAGLNVSLTTSETRLAAIAKVLNTQEGERGLFSQDWTTRVMGAAATLGTLAQIGGSAGWANVGTGLKALGTFALANPGALVLAAGGVYAVKVAWDAAAEGAKAYDKALKETGSETIASAERSQVFIETLLVTPLEHLMDIFYGIRDALISVSFEAKRWIGSKAVDVMLAAGSGNLKAAWEALKKDYGKGPDLDLEEKKAHETLAAEKRMGLTLSKAYIHEFSAGGDTREGQRRALANEYGQALKREEFVRDVKYAGRSFTEVPAAGLPEDLRAATQESARALQRLKDVTGVPNQGAATQAAASAPAASAGQRAPVATSSVAPTSTAQAPSVGVSDLAVATLSSAISAKLDDMVKEIKGLSDKQAKLALDVRILPSEFRTWLNVAQRHDDSRK